MKVVLLCGGVGKRMVLITKDKALLKFCGQPLILHQINTAREAGLNQLVIITNPDNTADLGSIVAGLADEPFILVNSNDIFETSACVQLLDEYHKNGYYSGYFIAC